MSVLSAEMAFEVGDHVYFKHAENDLLSSPKRFAVIARYVEECHGGVQRHYKLFGRDEFVPEIVLTKERPKYEEHGEEAFIRAAEHATLRGISMPGEEQDSD